MTIKIQIESSIAICEQGYSQSQNETPFNNKRSVVKPVHSLTRPKLIFLHISTTWSYQVRFYYYSYFQVSNVFNIWVSLWSTTSFERCLRSIWRREITIDCDKISLLKIHLKKNHSTTSLSSFFRLSTQSAASQSLHKIQIFGHHTCGT